MRSTAHHDRRCCSSLFLLARPQEALGYAGAYCQRSGGKSDGCATFVLRRHAVLVEQEGVAYKVQGHPVLDR